MGAWQQWARSSSCVFFFFFFFFFFEKHKEKKGSRKNERQKEYVDMSDAHTHTLARVVDTTLLNFQKEREKAMVLIYEYEWFP